MEQRSHSRAFSFCDACGSLRVRDVAEQLQQLFAERSVKPNVCGICKGPVKRSSIKRLDTEQLSEHHAEGGALVKEENVDDSYCDAMLETRSNSGQISETIKDEKSKMVEPGRMQVSSQVISNQLIESVQCGRAADDDDDEIDVHEDADADESDDQEDGDVDNNVSDDDYEPENTDGAGDYKYTCRTKQSSQNPGSTPDADVDITELTKCLDKRIVDMMGKPRSIEAPFKCKHCSVKEFKVSHPFLKHQKKEHPEHCPEIDFLMKKGYQCSVCGVRFKLFGDVKVHLSVHSELRPFTCNTKGCNKAFKTKKYLKNHQLRHEGKQILCSICGTSFFTTVQLQGHEKRIHLKLKPYKCSFCDRVFNLKSMKDGHERRAHIKVKSFMCEVCGKSFTVRADLRSHARHHTGEKPYGCEYCDYRCVRKDYLRKHLRTHTGEKPHQCAQCYLSFPLRSALVMHVKKQHNRSETLALEASARDKNPG